jgi:hypothetical protein
MSNKEDVSVSDNHVDRPSFAVKILPPWQLLHCVIDEGLGVALLEAREIAQDTQAPAPGNENDFDAKGKGLEVDVLFLSREDFHLDTLASWCSKKLTPDTTWMMQITRRDGKMSSGRIHMFNAHPQGIVACVRLTRYDREYPPVIDAPGCDLAKINVRFGILPKTRKIAYAKARE